MCITPPQNNELKQLWSVRGSPALSLYLPLDAKSSAVEALQGLARQADGTPGESGLTARALVQEAEAALTAIPGHMVSGTFVFLAGQGSRLRQLLPFRLSPLARLESRIHLRPLLCAADSLQPHTIVALGEDAIRIYQGLPNRLYMVHSAAGVSTVRSRARRLTLSRLDRELRRLHAADGPIVLCADAGRVRLFEGHSAFGAALSLTLPALRSVTPQAVERELNEPLARAVLNRRKRRLASFPRLLRAGQLRTGVRDIVAAARAGMVETLLLTRQGGSRPGPDRAEDEREDRLNLAAIQTLGCRGSVLCAEERIVPVAAAAVAFVRFGWA